MIKETDNRMSDVQAENENIPAHLEQMVSRANEYCEHLRKMSGELSNEISVAKPENTKHLIDKRTDAVILLMELEAYLQEINRSYSDSAYSAWHKNNRWQWLADAVGRAQKFLFGESVENVEFVDFIVGDTVVDSKDENVDIVQMLAKEINKKEREVGKIMRELDEYLPKLRDLSARYSRYESVVDVKVISARALEKRLYLLKSAWGFFESNKYNHIGKSEEIKKERAKALDKYKFFAESLLVRVKWVVGE